MQSCWYILSPENVSKTCSFLSLTFRAARKVFAIKRQQLLYALLHDPELPQTTGLIITKDKEKLICSSVGSLMSVHDNNWRSYWKNCGCVNILSAVYGQYKELVSVLN